MQALLGPSSLYTVCATHLAELLKIALPTVWASMTLAASYSAVRNMQSPTLFSPDMEDKGVPLTKLGRESVVSRMHGGTNPGAHKVNRNA